MSSLVAFDLAAWRLREARRSAAAVTTGGTSRDTIAIVKDTGGSPSRRGLVRIAFERNSAARDSVDNGVVTVTATLRLDASPRLL